MLPTDGDPVSSYMRIDQATNYSFGRLKAKSGFDPFSFHSEFEQRGATARQSSTSEQLRRRNQPKQNRDFHPTLVRLTRSAVRRYISARKKGG